ncbi:MAG TPA: hypothetical protein VGF16_14475 [Bryobacteraceae bacterium]|jgi:hypothetical protein
MESSARVWVRRFLEGAVILAGACLVGCSGSGGPSEPLALKTEKPFASAGHIEMQLEGGNYEIRPAAGDQIRVSFGGNTGEAITEVTTNGTQANLTVKNTPHTNFRAMLEVPKTSDLVIRLAGGNLEMAPIAGNKDIDSQAGNVEIKAGDPNDYADVDATVKVGNLDGGPFGNSDSSLVSHHLTWSGHGKYKLRANLGAGNLELHGQ